MSEPWCLRLCLRLCICLCLTLSHLKSQILNSPSPQLQLSMLILSTLTYRRGPPTHKRTRLFRRPESSAVRQQDVRTHRFSETKKRVPRRMSEETHSDKGRKTNHHEGAPLAFQASRWRSDCRLDPLACFEGGNGLKIWSRRNPIVFLAIGPTTVRVGYERFNLVWLEFGSKHSSIGWRRGNITQIIRQCLVSCGVSL